MPGYFDGRVIVLGVCGSIAAYKACEIASRLCEGGAEVIPVLTRSAQQFVGAASFEGIAGRRAITEMFEPLQNPDIEHIAVARRADLYLIAPASADMIAKAAHGIADDWLTTTLLATRAPLLLAPAMNVNMYTHPVTQANIEILRARGAMFVGPGSGRLACGDIGAGRLIDTQEILDAAAIALGTRKDLAGKHVLITSGGNHEPIDPVRYIGNRSSGKMGRALALEALRRGARVTVVTGPCSVLPPAQAEIVRVHTAKEMLDATAARFESCDLFLAAAAVADYHVETPAREKHKRGGDGLTLKLAPNADILAQMAARKRADQRIVGFAAETHDLLTHAEEKLRRKNLDLLVANLVGVDDSGFNTDTTRASFLAPDGPPEALPLLHKHELAERLFDRIASLPNS